MQDEEVRHQMALMLLTSAPTLARVGSYPTHRFTADIMEMLVIVVHRLVRGVLHGCCCCFSTLFKLVPHLLAESTVQHSPAEAARTLSLTLLTKSIICSMGLRLLQEVNKMGKKPIDIISHKKKLREWYQVLI